MAKPWLLELCACEGGMTAGYMRAGFNVVAVDMDKNRLKYNPTPYKHVGDAFAFVREHGYRFDAVHISCPCQGYTRGNAGKETDWPKLLPLAREVLTELGKPYVSENVEDAAWDMVDPVALCGCMFDLSVRDYSCTAKRADERFDHVAAGACDSVNGKTVHLQRLRLFETNWGLEAPRPCDHSRHAWVAGAYGGARRDKYEAKFIRKGGYVPPDKAVVKALLGIEHDMTWNGLFECVPPAYAEHIGRQLIAQL